MKKINCIMSASLILNVILACLCLFFFSRTILCMRLRYRLFVRPPDLVLAQKQLKAVLSRPEFADWYTLKSFETQRWCAVFAVTHNPDPTAKIQRAKLEALQSEIAKETGLQCWAKGWVFDPTNRAVYVGEICEFGYHNPFPEPTPK